MPESTETDTARQLAAIRRELRFMRWLLVFVVLAVGILLFAPAVAVRIAGWSAPAFDSALPVAAVLVIAAGFLAVAAAVVSRHVPSRPSAGKTGV